MMGTPCHSGGAGPNTGSPSAALEGVEIPGPGVAVAVLRNAGVATFEVGGDPGKAGAQAAVNANPASSTKANDLVMDTWICHPGPRPAPRQSTLDQVFGPAVNTSILAARDETAAAPRLARL